MSNENQMITISGFTGIAIGIVLMMLVNIDKEQRIHEQIKEIEYSVCEECWYEVFDGGWEYQFTD